MDMPKLTFLHFLEMQSYAVYQKVRSVGFSRACKHMQFFYTVSADRMALCTPGYAGTKQGLLSQASHRIPNTMEPRTASLAVTSFLEGIFL